jgi:hypothetical protein
VGSRRRITAEIVTGNITMTEITTEEAIKMMNRCKEEIIKLRRKINYLEPKAEAYDNLAIVLRFLQRSSMVSGEDLVWIIDQHIEEWTTKEEDTAT